MRAAMPHLVKMTIDLVEMTHSFFFVISSNVAQGGAADDTLPRDSRLRETADKSRLIDRFLRSLTLGRNDMLRVNL